MNKDVIIKKILITCLLFCFSLSIFANTPINMAYVEVNDHHLSNAGCYYKIDDNKPFFDMVSVFAANINGSDPNKPIIYFNPQVDRLLNHTHHVAMLQQKGIKVLVTLLGNHQNAGWSCMTDQKEITNFANKIVAMVNRYKLDGVDIDDEYSTCNANPASMLKIAKAIKENPDFKNKLLTKALETYVDDADFLARFEGHKLSDYLDYGWEMSYGSLGFSGRLSNYLTYGMTKESLYLGAQIDTDYHYAYDASTYITQQQFGGMMAYNLAKDSQDYLNALAKGELETNVYTQPSCLS